MIHLHARRTTTNQEEYDAFMPWRHVIQWRQGERKRIKRSYHRRWRKEVRRQLRSASPN